MPCGGPAQYPAMAPPLRLPNASEAHSQPSPFGLTSSLTLASPSLALVAPTPVPLQELSRLPGLLFPQMSAWPTPLLPSSVCSDVTFSVRPTHPDSPLAKLPSLLPPPPGTRVNPLISFFNLKISLTLLNDS